jgi:hypothetical protein
MPHESLERPCVDATARQGVAGRVPQHASMDREWHLSGHAKPFDELLSATGRKASTCFFQFL